MIRRVGTAAVATLALASAAAAVQAPRAQHPFVRAQLPSARALQAFDAYPDALIQLDRRGARRAAPLLRRQGATPVSRLLGIWRLPSRSAQRLIPRLEQRRLLLAAEPDRPIRLPATHLSAGDELIRYEWWIPVIGANRAEPPGPGVPLTIVDSGLDLSHPEFAFRSNTIPLNPQSVSADERHGTEVSSVAAAPADGHGLVGVYPQAVLQSYDAGGAGGSFSTSEEIKGILAAATRRAGVINLSLGSSEPDALEEQAIMAAFRLGSIVVASSGNEFSQGNPREYPASYNHVLTIAATDQSNQPTSFSSSSLSVDLAAPGQDIPAAIPVAADPSFPYDVVDGTSFSSPMVAAAAAWVWTARPNLDNTQVFNLMRWSTADVGPPGYDQQTGFGILNIPNALGLQAPPSDPQEPNEDIYLVKPKGLFQAGTPFLVASGHPNATISARLDITEDPEDIYRVSLPPHRRIVVTVRGERNVDLDLWGSKTRTVLETGAPLARDQIAHSHKAGIKADVVSAVNRSSRGEVLYVDAFLPKNGEDTGYRLTIRTRAAR